MSQILSMLPTSGEGEGEPGVVLADIIFLFCFSLVCFVVFF